MTAIYDFEQVRISCR